MTIIYLYIQKKSGKIKSFTNNKFSYKKFYKIFFSGATECELDKQGRVNLPQNLIEYASLTKEICIIGVSTRVEIWDRKKWEDYTSPANMDLDEIANQMSNLGI